jgi:hypothetical protein
MASTTLQTRKKYLDTMEKLSPGVDHLTDWCAIGGVEPLDGAEERRCACFREVTKGAILVSRTTCNVLVLGITCFDNFRKARETQIGDGEVGTFSFYEPGESVAITDAKNYSETVLRDFMRRSNCDVCKGPTELISFCTNCSKVFPTCGPHGDGACQRCRCEQEREREREMKTNARVDTSSTRGDGSAETEQRKQRVIIMSCPTSGGTVNFYICAGCDNEVEKCLEDGEIMACTRCAGTVWHGHFVALESNAP